MYQVKIFENCLSTWWILHNNELCGLHWICNEMLRIRGSIRNRLWPQCSYSDNVKQSNFRSFTWPCFVLVNKLMSALLPCEVESNLICSKSAGDSGLVMMYVADAMTNLQIFESHKENQEGSMLISEIAESDEVLKCLAKYKAPLVEQFSTAKLWLQYIEYIETLKLFIRAERPGNWSLHLVAVTTFLLQLAI